MFGITGTFQRVYKCQAPERLGVGVVVGQSLGGRVEGLEGGGGLWLIVVMLEEETKGIEIQGSLLTFVLSSVRG